MASGGRRRREISNRADFAGLDARNPSAATLEIDRVCVRQACTGTHLYFPLNPRSSRGRNLASSATGSDGSKAEGDGATSDSITTPPSPSSPASPASPKTKSASGTPFGKKTGAPTAAGVAAVAKKKPQPAKLPRSKNLLIVGLGNPGKEYTMTRHNAGFLVIDELAKRLSVDLKLRSAFQGEYGSTTYQGKSIGLLKPTTFMNNSGQSLRKVCGYDGEVHAWK